MAKTRNKMKPNVWNVKWQTELLTLIFHVPPFLYSEGMSKWILQIFKYKEKYKANITKLMQQFVKNVVCIYVYDSLLKRGGTESSNQPMHVSNDVLGCYY